MTPKKVRKAKKAKDAKIASYRRQHMKKIQKLIPAFKDRKPPSQWKKRGATVTLSRLKKAITGTYGIKTRIAKNLDVCYQSLQRALARLGAPAYAIIEQAKEEVICTAEGVVMDVMDQEEEWGVKFQAAKFVLVSKAGWQTRNEVRTIHGGPGTTINVERVQIGTLSLDLRRELLREIEAKEAAAMIEGQVVR